MVDGVIYLNVPIPAWKRLDRFEGKMYQRHHVAVELNDGTMLPVETYVIHPMYLYRLDKSDWDFNGFISKGKSCFQSTYKGYYSL